MRAEMSCGRLGGRSRGGELSCACGVLVLCEMTSMMTSCGDALRRVLKNGRHHMMGAACELCPVTAAVSLCA